MELYTSKWHGNIKNLEKLIGKKIIILKREDLEEKSEKILEQAKNKRVVVFVPGDPLIATTHISLISDAKKEGIDTNIIHNASIISAIGETGLHVYKFGPTVTIPFQEKIKSEQSSSVISTINDNLKRGLHTLLLLDIDVEKNNFMTPNEAIKFLSESELKIDRIIVFCRAGSDKPVIIYGKVENLIKRDFADPPFVIVVPGKLHFTEREYIETFEIW